MQLECHEGTSIVRPNLVSVLPPTRTWRLGDPVGGHRVAWATSVATRLLQAPSPHEVGRVTQAGGPPNAMQLAALALGRRSNTRHEFRRRLGRARRHRATADRSR